MDGSHGAVLLTQIGSHDQAEWREGVDPWAARREDKECVCLFVWACVCVCISMCEKKVPDFHNGVGVYSVFKCVGAVALFELF